MNKKILIVDDIEDNRLLIKDWFENDYLFEEADTGELAIKLTEQYKPDLILLDISLPDINGNEVAKRIRSLGEEFLSIPIIAVTAHTQAEDRERAMDAGCTDFLSKPFRAAELQGLIEKHLS
jgi:CheY-like chemotaxis protein